MALRRFSDRISRGWICPSVKLPESLARGWAASPVIPGARLLLDCRGRQIYKAQLERSGRPHSCFIHFFRNQSFSRSLRRTHAFHILQISEKMKREGLQTLDVLAALKPKGETLNWNSLLIASEIEEVNELPSAGRHVFQVHRAVEFDASIASTLANELSDFHDSRFIHGDLKTRHLLAKVPDLTDVSGNGMKRFHFVDLEKCKHHPFLPSSLLDVLTARDLVQLFASLPMNANGKNLLPLKSQFLAEYFTARGLSKRRIQVIQGILGLYSPGGALRQGRTLLASLADQFRRGSSQD